MHNDPRHGSLRMYFAYRAYAHFEGAWETCRHDPCRARKRCCFGPRGTFRWTGGVPLCRAGEKFRIWRAELLDMPRRRRVERQKEKARSSHNLADLATNH